MSRPALPPNRERRSYPDAPTVDDVDASRRAVVLHVRLAFAENANLHLDARAAGLPIADYVRGKLFG